MEVTYPLKQSPNYKIFLEE